MFLPVVMAINWKLKKKKKNLDNYSAKESKQMSYNGFILVEET